MTESREASVWRELESHHHELRDRHLRELFHDPDRARRYAVETAGLYLDYSKNRITDRTLELLLELARERDVPGWIEAMFRGERINTTEDRAALHVALRGGPGDDFRVDGREIAGEVRAARERMRGIAGSVRSGQWRGWTGETIRDVVSIGIGGSELGPEAVCHALSPAGGTAPRVHFLGNVDGHLARNILAGLDPSATLFVVTSKSFSTMETRTNAGTALAWLADAGIPRDGALARHFLAVTANAEAADRFGIPSGNRLPMWDWVGGRYSLWSAVGLPVALGLGMEVFEALLAGARAMDQHFREAPLERNMPVLLALLGIWYIDLCGAGSHAVLPYDHRLRRLPAHLQQLDMESNGKRVRRDGRPVDVATGPVVWGDVGTNGQHAFFQLLHQSERLIPADFIACLRPDHDFPAHHRELLASFLAQTEALMRGRTEAETRALLEEEGMDPTRAEALAPHQTFPGDRPSNSILLERLDPERLGALMALYEHKVFVQGAIWDINSFDQWGVELGKKMAGVLVDELAGGSARDHDPSTRTLLERCRRGFPP